MRSYSLLLLQAGAVALGAGLCPSIVLAQASPTPPTRWEYATLETVRDVPFIWSAADSAVVLDSAIERIAAVGNAQGAIFGSGSAAPQLPTPSNGGHTRIGRLPTSYLVPFLDQVGAEGWELVAREDTPNGAGSTYIFKRRQASRGR